MKFSYSPNLINSVLYGFDIFMDLEFHIII